jgi:hypothetical protein
MTQEPPDDIYWPPPIVIWRRDRTPATVQVIGELGKLLKEHPDNERVQRESLIAANEYLSSGSGSRSDLDSRKDALARLYPIEKPPGVTVLQSVDAYLAGGGGEH